MLASLKNFDFNQEKAARVLGATRFKAFCTVTFPQIRLATFGAGLFAFLTSFDEVVIAIFISGNQTTTLTNRSEEHTSELQSLMRISYAVFCLKKQNSNRPSKLTLYSVDQAKHRHH